MASLIKGRPAKFPGTCQSCALPIEVGQYIAFYRRVLMHAACANRCNGTSEEFAEEARRMARFRARHRAEVTKHRALLSRITAEREVHR